MVNPLSAATDGLISPDYLVLEIASEGLLIFSDTPTPPTPVVTSAQQARSFSEERKPVSGALDENELISEEEEILAIIKAFLACQN